MKCPNCGFDNFDDSRFCEACGTPLTAGEPEAEQEAPAAAIPEAAEEQPAAEREEAPAEEVPAEEEPQAEVIPEPTEEDSFTPESETAPKNGT